MSDWTETHRETLEAWLKDPSGGMYVVDTAIVAALAAIDRLTAERDMLADAIHLKRHESAYDWNISNLATLASAHRDDSETMDGFGSDVTDDERRARASVERRQKLDHALAEIARLTERLRPSDTWDAHEDLRSIVAALGLRVGARPYSCRDVVRRDVLPAIREL